MGMVRYGVACVSRVACCVVKVDSLKTPIMILAGWVGLVKDKLAFPWFSVCLSFCPIAGIYPTYLPTLKYLPGIVQY